MSFKILPEEIFLQLFELAREHDLSELSITTPEGKFKVRRAPSAIEHSVVPASFHSPLSVVEKAGSKHEIERGNLVKVVSPLMGIFYRFPAPGVEPFVTLGERVQPGDTLCIIEAMKVMNEITSEITGTIEEILPQNGDVVEEGSVLFLIKPEQAK